MSGDSQKVIIDTNLWISFLISKTFDKLDGLLLNNKVRLIFSSELLEEFIEVVNRPKFKKYFSKEDVEDLLNSIHKYADFVTVLSNVKLCRDEKDDFLLSLSVDSNADYLITGDNDLLDLVSYGDTKIVTMTAFLSQKF